MACRNLATHKTPDTDSVALWITHPVWRDYNERQAFPELRAREVAERGDNRTLHYLTYREAQSMLEDAIARRRSAGRGLKISLSTYISNLQYAIDLTNARRIACESPTPELVYSSDISECWRGTKAQIQAMGIVMDGPYPGEDGGPRRRVRTRDQRGYAVRLSAAPPDSPGLFEINIAIPNGEMTPMAQAWKRRAAENARLRLLKELPATPEEYRNDVARTFWTVILFTRERMQRSDGYRFAPEVVEKFMESMTDAYWGIKNGKTIGRSPRVALQQVMAASAKSDGAFQQFLSSVQDQDHED